MAKQLAMNGAFTTKVADCLIDHLMGTTVGKVEHFVTMSTIRLIDRDGSIYYVTIRKEEL
jgi:hypothetical protein